MGVGVIHRKVSIELSVDRNLIFFKLDMHMMEDHGISWRFKNQRKTNVEEKNALNLIDLFTLQF